MQRTNENISPKVDGLTQPLAEANYEPVKVLTKEGAVDTVELSETAAKELLVDKRAKVQEIQSKHSTTIQVLKKGNAAKIFGSVEAVEATKTALLAFAKKADSVASKTMTLEADQIGRVIGSKGSTLNAIRKDCNVQITISDNSHILQMRGEQKDLDKAEKREPRESKASFDKAPADTEKKATSAAKPKAKRKGYAGDDAAMDDWLALHLDAQKESMRRKTYHALYGKERRKRAKLSGGLCCASGTRSAVSSASWHDRALITENDLNTLAVKARDAAGKREQEAALLELKVADELQEIKAAQDQKLRPLQQQIEDIEFAVLEQMSLLSAELHGLEVRRAAKQANAEQKIYAAQRLASLREMQAADEEQAATQMKLYSKDCAEKIAAAECQAAKDLAEAESSAAQEKDRKKAEIEVAMGKAKSAVEEARQSEDRAKAAENSAAAAILLDEISTLWKAAGNNVVLARAEVQLRTQCTPLRLSRRGFDWRTDLVEWKRRTDGQPSKKAALEKNLWNSWWK